MLVKVVAMCVVRKVLDRVFTYEELLHLDDILPESKKKRTENSTRTDNAGGLELQVLAKAFKIDLEKYPHFLFTWLVFIRPLSEDWPHPLLVLVSL